MSKENEQKVETCSELEESNERVTQRGRDIMSAVDSQAHLTALPSVGLREEAQEPTFSQTLYSPAGAGPGLHIERDTKEGQWPAWMCSSLTVIGTFHRSERSCVVTAQTSDISSSTVP